MRRILTFIFFRYYFASYEGSKNKGWCIVGRFFLIEPTEVANKLYTSIHAEYGEEITFIEFKRIS
jgi:hypothetical protein